MPFAAAVTRCISHLNPTIRLPGPSELVLVQSRFSDFDCYNLAQHQFRGLSISRICSYQELWQCCPSFHFSNDLM